MSGKSVNKMILPYIGKKILVMLKRGKTEPAQQMLVFRECEIKYMYLLKIFARKVKKSVMTKFRLGRQWDCPKWAGGGCLQISL
jgi:hypothetical protein